ncbi:hypothetical protein EDD22DRAFT_960691 [Suillus occidentalis]|nr:hypothetical protein EDD22DRAFT_960691 [Suillus occidentalis]
MASPAPSDSESSSNNDTGVDHTAVPCGAMPTTADARAKRRIAALEDELERMRHKRGTKQRKTTYFVVQGRAIHRLVVLYTSLEDLIAENDRRYDQRPVKCTTTEDRLQLGYIELSRALPWLHTNLGDFDHEECEDMLRKLKKGADAARGDDTSCLKDLVAIWVNQHFHPSPLIRPDNKHLHGFGSDICGKLLCPAEWDWDQNHVKAGIRDRTTEYIVSENSWPLFLYENYTVNRDNLEEGLLKSKLLVLAFKAIFKSPSRKSDQAKVKSCVASIINMKKVTPRSIAYIACQFEQQVRFALLNVSSWRTIDGNFDYEAFWNNVVDFFENVPGPVTKCRVKKLLEWWTRKVFGTNHREDLTPEVVSHMSINTLAEQRKALEDAAFDSD